MNFSDCKAFRSRLSKSCSKLASCGTTQVSPMPILNQQTTNPQGSLATNVIKCRSGSCEQTPNDGVVGDKGGVLPVGSVSD